MSEERQDIGQRAEEFAKKVRLWLKKIPKTFLTNEDGKQLARSSGSIGANYIEANEAFTKKDCAFHLKICRKEAKETMYWLSLLSTTTETSLENERQALIKEAQSFKLIFHSIIQKYYS